MIKEVLKVCKRIDNGRTVKDVQLSLTEETGELATEIRIKYGTSYKEPDVDGILGESVDSILCLLDLIYVDNPNITEDDIMTVVRAKMKKWETKESEYLNRNEDQH